MNDASRLRAPGLAALLLVPLAAKLAAQAVSEPFDYSPPGADLLGQAGGTGFAGAWFASGFNAPIHDNYDVAAGSLAFPNLAVSGNSTASASTASIAGLGRNLAAPIAAGATTTVYFSFLLRPEGTLGQGAFNGFFGVYLDGTGNADLFAGKPGSAVGGQYVLENRGGSGQVSSGAAPVVGETVLLVVRAELRPGADLFTLHVNPDPCQPEPGAGTVKSDLDLGDVSALVVYSTGAFSLDELRLGSSFAEVVPCDTPEPTGDRVLVFSRTTGFRHDSIASGIAAVQALGTANGFAVDATENAALFTDANLAQYDAVIFLNTTGDILNAPQEAAFERYIQGGHGFLGIHSAADTEYGWAWYGGLVGAYFQSHPAIQAGTVVVADRVHPASAGLPLRWARTDEWYNYQSNPRGQLHVLATLDETTYSGGTMGHDHAIAWCHGYDGGRAFYTGGGHTIASYAEPFFRQHLLGGIRFAAGWVDADCGATVDASFDKVVLDANVNQPMELAVAGDGRVFFVERGGSLKIYKPSTASTVTAGTLVVTTANEDGLIGITLDPDFDANGWIYLVYSPAGSVPKQHVSRFEMNGDQLDLSSEELLLEVPTQRDQCCHSGGSLAFGPAGDLFISTGDNSNPFSSSGFAPLDERAGRSPWDSQKSSANRNDLRGKVLRITPLAGGGYTIPAGNLFPADGSAGRPEVYTMGLRNPFRIAVDPETGWLYWGDVGPDAGGADPLRGPAGYDEFNQARSAGNYGWPYCIGPNEAYVDFNFETGISGAAFNCAAPVNLSPNNTGGTALPPARAAWIWYPYADSTAFPAVNGGSGRTACAGPVYHFSTAVTHEKKLPAYYDDTLFLYEWSRMWIKEVKLDENGNLLKMSPFLGSFSFQRPIDLELGPDGALYVLEWGASFGGGVEGAKLSRIEYLGTSQRPPVAVASAAPTAGSVPLTVQFSSAGSRDPDSSDPITFAWSFRDDGVINSTAPNPSFQYTTAGNFLARLTVMDSEGATGTATVPIAAGNNRPVVTLSEPLEGGFFAWGETIAFNARVNDAEDGTTPGGIACTSLSVQPLLGHDDHAHPQAIYHDCEGRHRTDLTHSDTDNTYLVLEASYTDEGAPGVAPLEGKASYILQPKRKQAEHFTTNNGVLLETTTDVLGGGRNIGFIDDGDSISFRPMNLTGIDSLTFRVASAGLGGRIEVHQGSPGGPLVTTVDVPVTGGWQTWTDVTAPVLGGQARPTTELFFVFLRDPGNRDLFNVNWIDFNGTGIALPLLSKPGDCNQDALLDLSDGMCLLFTLFLGRPLPCDGVAPLGQGNDALLDFRADGTIDVSDAIAVFNHLFAGGPPHALGSTCRDIPGCTGVDCQ